MMGASATLETRKKAPTSLTLSRGVESLLRPSHFKETDGAQPSMLETKRGERAEAYFNHDFSRIPSQTTPVQFQAKLAINQPGDEYEQEADRIAEEVVNGSAAGISTWKAPGTTVMRQAAGKSSEKEEENYKDAAKKTGEAFLETDLGKKLTEQAKEKGEEFITSIPGMVITGVAAAGAVGYLAATNKELPIGLPEIPLDKLHPGLKMKITYEGPVLSPTKAMIMFSGTFGGPKEEKKPGMTKTEMEKAKTAKMAAEMAAFQEMLKTPEQKKAEEEALTKFTAEKFGPKLPGTKAGAPAVPSLTLTPPTQEYKKKSYKLLEEELKLDVPGIEIKPEEETEKKKKDEEKPLQRKAQDGTKGNTKAHDVPPIVHEVLQSPGQPLNPETRAFFEPRFGYDFSHVRVHADAKAAESARAVQARAYTVGRDIVFGAGQYAPRLADRRRLIAHELTHTIQNPGSKLQRSVKLSTAAGSFQATTYTSSDLDRFYAAITGNHANLEGLIAGTGKIYEGIGGVKTKTSKSYRKKLVKDILSGLLASPSIFEYKNFREVFDDLYKRAAASLYMRTSQGTSRVQKVLYPGKVGPKTNKKASAYWTIGTNNGYRFDLNSEGLKHAYEALRSILFDGTSKEDTTRMHCDYVISAIHFMVMAEDMGVAAFDDAVKKGDIKVWLEAPRSFDTTLPESMAVWGEYNTRPVAFDPGKKSLTEVYVNGESEILVGDHLMFYNHSAYNAMNKKQGESWRLENAFVTDKSGPGNSFRFQGHGYYSPTERKTFIQAMLKKLNTLIDRSKSFITAGKKTSLAAKFPFVKLMAGITSSKNTGDHEIVYSKTGKDEDSWSGWSDIPLGDRLTMPFRSVTDADYPNPFAYWGKKKEESAEGAEPFTVRRPAEGLRD